VRSVPALASVEVEFTSDMGVGTVAFDPSSPFFFLPNVTPQLLAKLARVPLAVVPALVGGPAKGEVRGM
jgi:hypothetical protein